MHDIILAQDTDVFEKPSAAVYSASGVLATLVATRAASSLLIGLSVSANSGDNNGGAQLL